MTDRDARRRDDALYRTAVGSAAVVYGGLLALMLTALAARVEPSSLLNVLGRPAVRDAVLFTLGTATLATAVAVAVVVPLACGLRSLRGPARLAADALLDLPHVVPPVVLGLMLLVAFGTGPLAPFGPFVIYRPAAVVIAQAVATAAFLLPAVRGLLDAIDPRVEFVARTLGAGRLTTTRLVTLPEIGDGLIAVVLIGWARAVGCFGPVLAFAGATRGRTEVLSMTVYLELTAGNVETALAVAALSVVIAGAVLTAARVVLRRRMPAELSATARL